MVLTKGSLLLVPTMALHGAVLIFLFAPLHETIHRTAFRSRWLNDTVAFFCGLSLLLPPEYFRAFHFAHHRYTQDPARDPELAGGCRPASRGAWLLHLTGFPYWTWQARVLARHAFGRVNEPFLTPAAGRRVVREARVVIAVYGAFIAASVASGSPLLLLLWVGPALFGQPWLRAFLAAEHMLCPELPDMAVNTRTTLTYAWHVLVVYLAAWVDGHFGPYGDLGRSAIAIVCVGLLALPAVLIEWRELGCKGNRVLHARTKDDPTSCVRGERLLNLTRKLPEVLVRARPASARSGRQNQIGRRRFPIVTGGQLVLDSLTLGERGESCSLHCRDVNEYVLVALFRNNETVTLGGVEPLHSATSH